MSCVTDKASLDDENVWDDALLIKAYDSSLKLAKEELARRIARSTNGKKTPTKVRDADPTEDDEYFPLDSKQSEEGNPSFKVGDYARATYDDGVDYEGKILSIDELQGMCRLRYIGYDNEQDVRICDLVPSWGKKVRRLQFARAKVDLDANDAQNGQECKKTKTRFPMAQPSGLPFGAIPPPPPMPPMLGQSLCEDSEHLSAMLMSWYMSGYYTGIYQGMQMSKTKTKSKK